MCPRHHFLSFQLLAMQQFWDGQLSLHSNIEQLRHMCIYLSELIFIGLLVSATDTFDTCLPIFVFSSKLYLCKFRLSDMRSKRKLVRRQANWFDLFFALIPSPNIKFQLIDYKLSFKVYHQV